MADGSDASPTLRNSHAHTDKAAGKFLDQTERLEQKAEAYKPKDKDGDKKDKQPAGGFDRTPIPKAPPGYTLKITFHRAHNLPCADINSLSSDPYIVATMKTTIQKRHKQDPDLTLRTPTIHRKTEPEWKTEWIVANIPSSGFNMKLRLYDEDPADHDDRLGNVHINVDHIDERWKGFKEQSFHIKKRMGSKRAYALRGCFVMFSSAKMGGEVIVSIENLGKTETDNGGRAYTVGPLPWSRHYSPLIGRLIGVKDGGQNDNSGKTGEKKAEKYK